MAEQQSFARSKTLPLTPERWIAAVQQAWRAAGHRITEPRVRVLHSIASYEAPFSAEQLFADLQRGEGSTGRATVYRALEQLSSAGWIARIHTSSGESAYSPSWPGHVHHLVCSSCGKVIIFTGCALDSLMSGLAQQTGFAIAGHMLEVYGLCSACQQQLA
jgi:Fur family ferric uptake transcriptional regulator